jgi:hypothetical protein
MKLRAEGIQQLHEYELSQGAANDHTERDLVKAFIVLLWQRKQALGIRYHRCYSPN